MRDIFLFPSISSQVSFEPALLHTAPLPPPFGPKGWERLIRQLADSYSTRAPPLPFSALHKIQRVLFRATTLHTAPLPSPFPVKSVLTSFEV